MSKNLNLFGKKVIRLAIDSHMHINNIVLKNQDKYIDAINTNLMIEKVINVGLDLETSKEALTIAKMNDKFFVSIGIHPLYIKSQNLDDLYDLAQNPKVVAIGEIGLDNLKDNFDEQKRYLIKQIIIANELRLPVIIHSNNSNKIVIDIFERFIKPKYGCVFHCFQPDLDDLKYLIDNNFYISFAGRITYKNARKSIQVANTVPNDLFLIETDSPYISPEPLRNQINETANIKYIINKLADIKQLSFEEIEDITTNNAKKLFRKIGG